MSVITASGSPSGLQFSDGAAGPVVSGKATLTPHLTGGNADLVTNVSLLGVFGIGEDDAGGLDWQDRALCAEVDPERWFPEKGGSTREAKKVCNGSPGRPPCPVRAECLEYALEHDERFGIYGGLSERERRRLKRETE